MQSTGFMIFTTVQGIIHSYFSFNTHASLSVSFPLLWCIIHALGMNKIYVKWVNQLFYANYLYTMLMVHQLDWVSNLIGYYSKDYCLKQLCFSNNGFFIFIMLVFRIFNIFIFYALIYNGFFSHQVLFLNAIYFYKRRPLFMLIR